MWNNLYFAEWETKRRVNDALHRAELERLIDSARESRKQERNRRLLVEKFRKLLALRASSRQAHRSQQGKPAHSCFRVPGCEPQTTWEIGRSK